MTQSITITLSYEDYLSANWMLFRKKWVWRGIHRFLAFTTPLYGLIGFFGEGSDGGFSITHVIASLVGGFLFALGVLGVLILYFLWCIPRSAKKLYAQQPSASSPYDFSFDERGMKAIGQFQTSDLPWSHIQSWLESPRLLILSQTALTFFCLPKDQMNAEQIALLKQRLAEAGVKNGV